MAEWIAGRVKLPRLGFGHEMVPYSTLVMLNLFQHLTAHSRDIKTLKQVQGDESGLLARS
jgi:hypothetical protein